MRLFFVMLAAAVGLAAGAPPADAVVAFNSDRCQDGNCLTRIWVMQDDGSALRPLTDGGPPSGNEGQRLGNESDTSPTWSPAATRVAFTRYGGYGGQSLIYSVARDGSDLRRISPPADQDLAIQDSWPDWSPLGALIAFESRREVDGLYAPRIWVTTPDGSIARPITDGRRWAHLPRFTPDGLRVVYIEYGDATRLMSVPVTGGISLPVVAGDLAVGPFALTMSPDLRTVALSLTGADGPGLYLLDALTGSLRKVGDQTMAGASWSFVGPALISNSVTSPRSSTIVRLDLARPGAVPQQLTDGTAFDGFPDWGGPDVLEPVRDLLPPVVVVVPSRASAGSARAAHAGHRDRTRVAAVDTSGVRSLHMAVARRTRSGCRFLVRGRLARASRCSRPRFFAVRRPSAWRRGTRGLTRDRYRVWFKPRDGAGNVDRRPRPITLRLP